MPRYPKRAHRAPEKFGSLNYRLESDYTNLLRRMREEEKREYHYDPSYEGVNPYRSLLTPIVASQPGITTKMLAIRANDDGLRTGVPRFVAEAGDYALFVYWTVAEREAIDGVASQCRRPRANSKFSFLSVAKAPSYANSLNDWGRIIFSARKRHLL